MELLILLGTCCTLNLATNLPQILTTVENIDFSYFVDIANVWGVDYSDAIGSSNKIRSSPLV